jgi:hypothetical protein
MFENALISRRIIAIDADAVTVEEVWDTTHPECPFVVDPCHHVKEKQAVTLAITTVKGRDNG